MSYLPLYVFSGKTSLSGPPLHCLGMSRHFELMYNMGIQLLHCGKALPAFECLIEAVQMFQINPHLWLRLAECCIMAYREVSGKALPAFECLIEAVQMFKINPHPHFCILKNLNGFFEK